MPHFATRLVLSCATVATLVAPSLAAVPTEKLQMTCMAVQGGVPSEPTIYTLTPSGSLLKGEIEISAFSAKPFAMTRDSEGVHVTNSQHEWVVANQKLRRKVWPVGNEAKGFVEIYDFKKQEIVDAAGEDSCYHSKYRPIEKR